MATNTVLAGMSKGHTIYKNEAGKRVPSVTTILGVKAKPALYAWHNRQGLAGVNTQVYVQKAADAGTCAHAMVHADIMGTDPQLEASRFDPALADLGANGYLQWLEWRKGRKIVPIVAETPLVSEIHQYGGTVDFFGLVDADEELLDFKTSDSGIWPEMRYQVAAYFKLLEEKGYHPRRARIIRLGKKDQELTFETEEVQDIDGHFEMFLACKKVWDLEKQLEARW